MELRVYTVTGGTILHPLLLIAGGLILRSKLIVFVRDAVRPVTVTPRSQVFPDPLVLETEGTPLADSDGLGGDVWEHGPGLGAGAAHDEATGTAVVPPVSDIKLAKAAHAYGGRPVGNPSDGEGVAGFAASLLQPLGPAVLDVLHPGLLLLRGGGRHEEGLAGGLDQPLVFHV